MLEILRQIKSIAVEVIKETRQNDSRRDKMRDVVELCDMAMGQCCDDGK